MAYGVVRTDNMRGTDVRAGLVSVRFKASDKAAEIENGNVAKIGALENGSREIYTATAPAANDKITDIVLIASPEIQYDDHEHNLDEFINKAGDIARGYHLYDNDIFSVTADCISGTPKVGSIIELMAGTKLKAVDSATASSTTIGKIIDKNIVGRYTYYAIRVTL